MSVVVLDEAGMVGTRDLAELARHAESAGAKLVLVGDDAQLPEIAAGGSFRALAAEPRRARAGRQPAPGARLGARGPAGDPRRAGPQEAVAAYQAHGRIHVAAGSPRRARAALVADWLAAHRRRRRGADDRPAPRRRRRAVARGPGRCWWRPARSAGPRATCPRAGRRRRPGDGAAKRRRPRGPERHAGDGARPGRATAACGWRATPARSVELPRQLPGGRAT